MADGLYRVVTSYLCAGFVLLPLRRVRDQRWESRALRSLLAQEDQLLDDGC